MKLITTYNNPDKVSFDKVDSWGDYYMDAERWKKHRAEALAKDAAHLKLVGRKSGTVTVHNHPYGAACLGYNHEVYA